MKTWKQLIKAEMAKQQDTWENIEYASPSITQRKLQFSSNEPYKDVDADFYIQELNTNQNNISPKCEQPFLIYTKGWIYFTVVYDGIFWVGSVPRHPIRRFMPEFIGSGA